MPNAKKLTRVERWEKRFDRPVIAAALLSIPVIVLEESTVPHGWRVFDSVLDWAIWAAFFVELAVMLIVVRERRINWLWHNRRLETAIVVVTLPYWTWTIGVLRVFRLLRLLVIPKKAREFFSQEGVKLAAAFAAICAFAGAAIFADVERHRSMWDGTWWAITTMATVGYGDVAPKTLIGRLTGMGLMVVGISFFALVTGAIAKRFLVQEVREVAEKEEQIVSGERELREQILGAIRDLSARLRELEQTVEKL
jgi:voltage-gated potassium channel